MGRSILHQSRRLKVCSSHLSLNPSKTPACPMEATDVSQLHCRYWKHLESLLKLLWSRKRQNFTSRDALEGAALLQHLIPLYHSQLPVKLVSRELIFLVTIKEENPLNRSTEMGRELRLCLSCLKKSWPCLKSVSGQPQSKTIRSNERGCLF